jgi:DNA invertase Pin-like site-specific DNA recombinase
MARLRRNHNEPLRLAFSYSRISRTDQQKGAGLDRQADMAAAWCQQHAYQLDTQLDLSDRGRSAFKGHHISRGALGRFLELAQQGKLGPSPVLLIEAVDRLSRLEPMDALDDVFLGLVKRSGVTIIDLEDGQEYSRATLNQDAMALVKLALKCQASHDFSRRLSRRLSDHWQRVRDGIRSGAKVYRGDGGRHPFWLDLSPDRSAWILNEHADAVAAAFNLMRANGLLAVATLLNQQGYTGPKGKPWTSHSVRRLVTDPAVMGDLVMHQTAAAHSERAHRRWQQDKAAASEQQRHFTQPEPLLIHTETISGFYPPVVSAEVWHQTQQLMTRRKTAPEARGNRARGVGGSLLEGMARCQGGGLMGIAASRIRSTGELRQYLRCRLRRERKPCPCNGKGWQLTQVHDHLLVRLSAHLLEEALIPGADGAAELMKLQQRLTAAQELQTTAAKALANAEKVLEQALEQGNFDLSENASAIIERKRQELRRAQAQVSGLQRDVELVAARATPFQNLDAGTLIRQLTSGQVTQQQRNQLHRALREADLQVVLDDSDLKSLRVGMRFGGAADLQWQPLDPGLARMVADLGGTELKVGVHGTATFEAPDEGHEREP